jgi:hypothetical protein
MSPIRVPSPLRVSSGVALVSVLAALVGASTAHAGPAPPPAQQAVAIVKAGVVWYENGVVRLTEPDGERRVLAATRPAPAGPPQIGSSATAVVVDDGGSFTGGLPPASLARLGPFHSPSSGRLHCWRPEDAVNIPEFVVAGDELIVAAERTCGPPGSSRQPLFEKDLRGGPWRVVRWLPNESPPVLAAEGSLLAIGVQHSLTAAMDVQVLDADTGSTRSSLKLPEGYLAFAGRNRLIVSVPTFTSFPLYIRLETPSGDYGGSRGSLGGEYDAAMYNLHGALVRTLGTIPQQPTVSAMRRVAVTNTPQSNTATLSVQSVSGSSQRSVIGFDQGRSLIALAWRWPLLAIVETTATALPDGTFNCSNGRYSAPSAPFLTTFDLARTSAFVPAPAEPPQPSPQKVLETCGPPSP